MEEEKAVLFQKKYPSVVIKQRNIYSEYLEREVIVDLYIPIMHTGKSEVDLLLINDGQDLRTMEFGNILDQLLASKIISPLLCAGIHCGTDRMNEYGTAYRTDYEGRGAKAGLYNKFIFDELLPFLQAECNIFSFKQMSFAGFSLGGLSALDIVWNHSAEFRNVGVFSGSLWWRSRGYEDKNYNPAKDRIMHMQVQKGKHCKWLKFFFECGLLDETADRNNNGIIDSIEDTTDLIETLKGLGYTNEQVQYLELEDGGHNVETLAKAFPKFLLWGWGKEID